MIFTDKQLNFIEEFVKYESEQDKAFGEWEECDEEGEVIMDAYEMAASILETIKDLKEMRSGEIIAGPEEMKKCLDG